MNIYFSGIGGVGIGPLAEIALDAGYHISGSDIEESVMTKDLQDRGVKISVNQDGSFLLDCHHNNPIDWFVYTSALPDNHPELLLAQEMNIKIAKRDEILAYIIKNKGLKLIAVAGTHGKTTATGMLVWTLQQLGIPISYSIGTTTSFGPSGKLDPKSEYFIYECDEFDRNFLHFNPYFSLITSIDYDHPDTYPTASQYLEAFQQFALNSDQVISWRDQHGEIFTDIAKASLIDVEKIQPIKLAGNHNRRNATLVQIALNELGISQDTADILSRFPGTSRRFERLANNLYSDYGHHPVEIAATLQLASELSEHVVLIYQPHQNIRQHEIKDQYTNQFELAEATYWLPTHLSREDPNLPILTSEDLIKNITNKQSIKVSDFDDKLWQTIQHARSDNKLVLAMGAGKIDQWIREKLANTIDQ